VNVINLKSDEARNRWRDVLDEIAAGNDVVIQRYNKPVAAMIRYEEYLALQEELEEFRLAKRAQAALEEWRRDPSTARSWEEVEADLYNG
jgi:prevent-host-death family protein